jgi:hypothetical protein
MIEVKNNTKIYILIPHQCEAGGVESLHQLSDKMLKLGFNCFTLYRKDGGGYYLNGTPMSYKEYSVAETLNLEDNFDNIVIVPEVWTCVLDEIKKAKKVIWWLSVDNNLGSPEGKFNKWEDKSYYHLCQSFYAKKYVEKNGCVGFYLNDYINSFFFEDNSLQKKDIILYNPAKGMDFTSKIILNMRDYNFIALKGFNRATLMSFLKSSKLYIDFGNHPGMDRIPRESVINNCCLITSKIGSSIFDINIEDKFKLEKNVEEVSNMIKECINNYESNIFKFNSYKKHILNQELEMENNIEKTFIKNK